MNDRLKNITAQLEQMRSCSICKERSWKVECLKRVEGAMVIEITCLSCRHKLGTALIRSAAEFLPITQNDVDEAKKFISQLGSDWRKYLPV